MRANDDARDRGLRSSPSGRCETSRRTDRRHAGSRTARGTALLRSTTRPRSSGRRCRQASSLLRRHRTTRRSASRAHSTSRRRRKGPRACRQLRRTCARATLHVYPPACPPPTETLRCPRPERQLAEQRARSVDAQHTRANAATRAGPAGGRHWGVDLMGCSRRATQTIDLCGRCLKSSIAEHSSCCRCCNERQGMELVTAECTERVRATPQEVGGWYCPWRRDRCVVRLRPGAFGGMRPVRALRVRRSAPIRSSRHSRQLLLVRARPRVVTTHTVCSLLYVLRGGCARACTHPPKWVRQPRARPQILGYSHNQGRRADSRRARCRRRRTHNSEGEIGCWLKHGASDRCSGR